MLNHGALCYISVANGPIGGLQRDFSTAFCTLLVEKIEDLI
jgi:hypothetical protein